MDPMARWRRVEYDHGPVAEIKDIELALQGMLAGTAPGHRLEVNVPFLLHLLYSTEWASFQVNNGSRVSICPNLAPRCARARSKHLGVPDEVPKGTGCHTHAGRGWTNEFAANNIDASRLLPLTGDVLTPDVLSRTTLSADAYRYVVERNKLYVDLKLFPPA